MMITNKAEAANWMTAAALVIATALFVWQASAEHGWLGVAFGRFSLLFWAVICIWVVCVACALRWERRWWVLITAPIVLYPVVMSGVLLGACMGGDCL